MVTEAEGERGGPGGSPHLFTPSFGRKAMRSTRQGFTLFELVLVAVLLVILAAISVPSLESLAGYFRATAASDAVRACWAQARARAMNDGTPYRFSVMPGKGNYRLAPDSANFWAG